MIRNICEKVLDKTLKRGYNIRMDKRVDIDTFINTFVDEYSFNKERSQEYIKIIVRIGEQIEKVWNNYFPTKALPVIAGGSVRDIVFGRVPKDFDIFMSVKGIGEEWKQSTGMEDGTEMLLQAFIDESFPTADPSQGCYQLGEKYENVPDSLYVFETWPVNYDDETPFQFIGTESTEEPLKYINSFDYGLVKIGYNIASKEFFVSKEFLESLSKSHTLLRYGSERKRDQTFLEWLYNAKNNLLAGNNSALKLPNKTLEISYEEKKTQETQNVAWKATTTGTNVFDYEANALAVDKLNHFLRVNNEGLERIEMPR